MHCQYWVAASIIDTGTPSVVEIETKLYTEFLSLTIKQYESVADLNIWHLAWLATCIWQDCILALIAMIVHVCTWGNSCVWGYTMILFPKMDVVYQVIVCIWKWCPCSSPQPEVEEIPVDICLATITATSEFLGQLVSNICTVFTTLCTAHGTVICCIADFYYDHPVLVYHKFLLLMKEQYYRSLTL